MAKEISTHEELDETIKYLCNVIRDEGLPRREAASLTLALASLTEARAKMVNYCRQ